MKKIITAIAIASMLSTPAMARDRRHHDNGHRSSNAGAVIAGIVGGVILGAAISEGNRGRRYEHHRYDDYPEPRHETYDRYGSNVYESRCRDVRRVDYYGNVYYQRFCN